MEYHAGTCFLSFQRPVLALRLKLNHMVVNAPLPEQAVRAPLLRHSSVREDDDLIRSGHSAHSVRNDEHRLILYQPGERRLDERFILYVEGCGRLIEEDNGCVF